MYQTKPRLNAFNQPSFLRHNSRQKKPIDTFWDDDDIRPFRLSIPEHFTPTTSKVFPPRQSNTPPRDPEPAYSQKQQERSRPANSPRQKQYAQQPRTFRNRQSESYIYNRPHSTLTSYLTQKIYSNWIEKELYFSMNKLSVLVLVIGLFFLSSLLFITGFLVAVNIYDIGAPKTPPMANMNIPSPSINMHTMETPRLPAPPTFAMPGIPTPMQNLPTTPPMIVPAVAAPVPTMPNPNIMKMGTQGTQMADTPINNTARIPSAYVQPPQALAPTQQQAIPQSGGQYIQNHQQVVVAQHMPSQGYTQQQNPYPQQTMPAQASAPQQQIYTQHANQPTQHYYPPNPGTYHQTGGR